jgi:Uma2 family endonuclease
MLEYQSLGVKLGLLVNPQDRKIEVYRLGQAPEILDAPTAVNCEDVMSDFTLNMSEIW